MTNAGYPRGMLMSIRPSFAERIMDGSKTVELRRQMPRFPIGGLVVLYASTPVNAVIGVFRLQAMDVGKPKELWSRVGTKTCVDWPCYREYFKGAERAVGLHVGDRWVARYPLQLSAIRAEWRGFRPPQSFRYIEAVPRTGLAGLALAIDGYHPLHLSPLERR